MYIYIYSYINIYTSIILSGEDIETEICRGGSRSPHAGRRQPRQENDSALDAPVNKNKTLPTRIRKRTDIADADQKKSLLWRRGSEKRTLAITAYPD